MNRLHLNLLIGLLSATVLPGSLFSQNARDSIDIGDLYIDYSIPDITAGALLGVGASGVEQVGNVKKLALAAYNLYNGAGQIKPSIALDIAPAQLLNQLYYRAGSFENPLLRLAANTSLSVATANDESGAQFAAGFKILLIDKAHPLLFGNHGFFDRAIAVLQTGHYQMGEYNNLKASLVQFLNRSSLNLEVSTKANVVGYFEEVFFSRMEQTQVGLQQVKLPSADSLLIYIAQLSDIVWGQGNAVPADKKPAFDSLITFIPMAMNLPYAVLRDELNASFDTLRQNWQFEHWNAGRLEIRGGAVWNSSDSTWSNLATRKFSCAVSYSGRLFKSIRRSQFTFAAQGSRHWASSLGEGVPNLKWSWEGGARYMVLLSGKREDEQRFRAYLGGRMAWANYTLPDGSDSTVLDGRLTAGVEFRLAKGTWAELAIANQITNVNEANALGRMRFLPMGGLKYTLNSQPRFSETRN